MLRLYNLITFYIRLVVLELYDFVDPLWCYMHLARALIIFSLVQGKKMYFCIRKYVDSQTKFFLFVFSLSFACFKGHLNMHRNIYFALFRCSQILMLRLFSKNIFSSLNNAKLSDTLTNPFLSVSMTLPDLIIGSIWNRIFMYFLINNLYLDF